LLKTFGAAAISKILKRSLNGLKWPLLRMLLSAREIMKFDNAEKSTSLDRLVTPWRQSLDWPCQGRMLRGGLSLSRHGRGDPAHPGNYRNGLWRRAPTAIAVSCPMCQVQSDLRQQDINKQTGRN